MDHEHATRAIRLQCSRCRGYHPAPADAGFDRLLATACVTVGESTRTLYDEFRMGASGGRWDVDREAAHIRWTDPEGRVAEADYQMVGGWIEHNGSFLWGWDHPQRSDANTRRLQAVRDHGAAEGCPVLTTACLIVTSEDAWHLADIAAYLIGWPGVYRAKVNDSSWAYFAFSQPSWQAGGAA